MKLLITHNSNHQLLSKRKYWLSPRHSHHFQHSTQHRSHTHTCKLHIGAQVCGCLVDTSERPPRKRESRDYLSLSLSILSGGGVGQTVILFSKCEATSTNTCSPDRKRCSTICLDDNGGAAAGAAAAAGGGGRLSFSLLLASSPFPPDFRWLR